MAATTVTITGTAKYPSTRVVPGAVVTFRIDEGTVNSGTTLVGTQAVAAADGTFSIDVPATDDAGTLPANAKYDVEIVDPVTGTSVTRFRAAVPHTPTPTTLAAITPA